MIMPSLQRLANDVRASVNLSRLILSSPLPHTVIATLVILWFVFFAYLLIDNFAKSQLDTLIDPWLSGRPHFAWSARRCEQGTVEDLEQLIRQQGFRPFISCVASGKVQFMKKRPGPFRFSAALAVEYQPDLLALAPGITTDFAEALLHPTGDCLAELGEDPLLSGSLADAAVRSTDCDHDGPLPVLMVGRSLYRWTDLAPGATVAVLEDIFFDDLPNLGDPELVPNLAFVVAGSFTTGDGYLDRLLLLPPGSLANLERYREAEAMILARTEGASSIAELVDLGETLKPFARDRELGLLYSVGEHEIWELQGTLIGTLRIIILVISILVMLTLFIGVNQLIQSERRLFALARICGYRRLSILLALLYLTILALLLIGIVAFITSYLGGNLMTWLYFPELNYWFKPAGLIALWRWSATVAIPVGLMLLWLHFSQRIADELQRVRQDS